ncbi:MAG: hypothetical protein JXB32_16635 [Deltaproteobacteria bacterium]|nr:hypothetical protein [Deltaproteobacteria bacterium]
MPDERLGTSRGAGWIRAATLLGAVFATGVAACGDGHEASNCEPSCTIHEMCVDGRCVPIDAGLDVLEVVDDAGDAPDVETEDDAEDDGAAEDAALEDVGPEDVDAGGHNIGDPCREDSDCRGPGDATCVTAIVVFGNPWEWPGGYCTSTCDSTDLDSCGEGALCLSIPLVGWNGCVQECTPGVPDECREAEGYQCLDPASIPGGLVPAPFCAPMLF